jgi:uncharacterized spore protein YtfJ
VQIEPVAVIAVGRDGVPRIMCVETEPDAAEKMMKQLPELLGNATKVFSERVAPLLGKLVNRTGPAIAAAAKEALPESATPLLESKKDE